VAVGCKLDGRAEDVLPAREVVLRHIQLTLGCLLRRGDALLLRLLEIERDRVRVESLEELVKSRREASALDEAEYVPSAGMQASSSLAFDGEQLPIVGHAFQAVRTMIDERDLRAGH
jgi:hypothetical protein